MMDNNVPSLRFKEFSGKWEQKILKEIAKFSKGKNISKADICENGKFECIRYGELYTKYNETIDKVYSKTNLDKKDLVFSEANDIIIPASGESAIDIATASCVLRSGIALGGDLNIIKTKENGVFLSYYFNNKKRYEIASKAQGISVIHIYAEHLKSLHLNIPTVAEQEKIANYLSALDEKINLLSEKEKNLAQYKKAMMQKLFAQEIRFKDDEGKAFEDWEEKKLGEVGNIISGLTYSPNDIDKNGILVLRSSNIKDNKLTFCDNVYVNTSKFNPVKLNDILICVRNGSKDLIGKNALVTNDAVGMAFGAFMSIYRSKANKYIYQWMQHADYKKVVNRNLGATINSINGNDLKEFKIPYPCVAEQEKIANFLSAIDEKINAVQKQKEAMQAFKKAMLQQMFV